MIVCFYGVLTFSIFLEVTAKAGKSPSVSSLVFAVSRHCQSDDYCNGPKRKFLTNWTSTGKTKIISRPKMFLYFYPTTSLAKYDDGIS